MVDLNDRTEKLVPLHDLHVAAGAQIVPFGGYLMPLKYTSIKEEHHAVRQAVGLFDVSHMGRVEVHGPDALAQVNYWVSNDVSTLQIGKALYGMLCNEAGGIVDDLVVYRLGEERFLLCINAANRDKDLAHFQNFRRGEAQIEDQSEETIQLALQGPMAEQVLQHLAKVDLSTIPFFGIAQVDLVGIPTLLARTGYTGEDGFELYLPLEGGREVFKALLQFSPQDLTLCGLGCRDTLRLEAGLALHGQDIDEETTPLQAGLSWTVKFEKEGGFVGREALLQEKTLGIPKLRRGFRLKGRGVLRSGYEVYSLQGDKIGQITSGGYSPTLEGSIGLGYINRAEKDLEDVLVEIRGKMVEAEVVKPPFYKRK